MMQTLSHFLAMGGYGFFVWSAYGLSALVLVLNVIFAIRRERFLLAELARKATPSAPRVSAAAEAPL